jgi:hypothetical protein
MLFVGGTQETDARNRTTWLMRPRRKRMVNVVGLVFDDLHNLKKLSDGNAKGKKEGAP